MPSPGHSCLLSYSVRLYRSQSSRVIMQSNRYQNLCGLTNCDCFVTLARPTVVLTGSPGLLSNKGSSTFQSTAVLWYLLLRLQGLPQSGKGGVNNCPWAVKWCTSPQSPSASQPWVLTHSLPFVQPHMSGRGPRAMTSSLSQWQTLLFNCAIMFQKAHNQLQNFSPLCDRQ